MILCLRRVWLNEATLSKVPVVVQDQVTQPQKLIKKGFAIDFIV